MQKSSHPMEPAEMMAYLDGELPVERAATAATHLERCAECQALAADMRTVSQSLLAWQVDESGARVTPALAAAFGERRSGRTWRMAPWAWGLATAGVVLLLVAAPLRRQHTGDLLSVVDRLEPMPPAQALLRSSNQPLEPRASISASPMVARTAALSLTTREFERTRAGIGATLARHHGYLASLNISAPAGAARSLNASLRVPAGDLVMTLEEIKKLGHVDSEEQNGEEVGEQYRDLEARLTNARNTEQRLTDILRQRTGKLSDVLDVERELDRVRGEIERMDAEKKGLTKRVDFATLQLTVSEVYRARLEAAPDSIFGRIRNAAVDGYRTMAGGAVAVVVLLVAAAPTVLLGTLLLFFPVRYVWRRWRRRA